MWCYISCSSFLFHHSTVLLSFSAFPHDLRRLQVPSLSHPHSKLEDGRIKTWQEDFSRVSNFKANVLKMLHMSICLTGKTIEKTFKGKPLSFWGKLENAIFIPKINMSNLWVCGWTLAVTDTEMWGQRPKVVNKTIWTLDSSFYFV